MGSAPAGEVERVVVGMDPHKRSVTIEVMAGDEAVLGGGRFATTAEGYRAMRQYVAAWPERTWAIEGCAGIGGHVATRLLGDGEQVVDVPPKLSGRARVFATGQGRKTDATDAHSVALVGTRMSGLRPVVDDAQLAVLRVLVDRRRSLGDDHTRMVAQLHHLLLQLIPGGAKKDDARAGAATRCGRAHRAAAGRRPARRSGPSRRRLKALKAELTEAVRASGSHLMDLHGIGPAGAARILADVGDVRRFPDRNHFASWTGTAPLDASSGQQIRHRLSRAGNRRLNHVLYIAAFVQLRHDTAGRAYYRRKLAAGKTPMEAMRCLKRRLSDAVYRQLRADSQHQEPTPDTTLEAGPGGHSGATLTSSAADLTPHVGTSDQPQPEPAPATIPGPQPTRHPSMASPTPPS